MRRFLRILLAWILCAPLPAGQQQIQDLMAELAEITGLKPLRAIRQHTMDRDELRRYIESQIREQVKPAEIRAEELTLKKFGFVPKDFDLRKSTIDLLSEQAAAFYDFRKKRLFLLSSAPAATEQALLVHELAHALADQHFHLERFIKRESNDDGAIARMAVMEGQASWLMAEYLARRSGQSLKTSPAILDMMSRPETGADQFPVLAKAPLYLQESLLFPYVAGIKFQHRLFEELGQPAFREVFLHPPLSSQQIIHPELYRKGVRPSTPRLPRLVSEKGYRSLAQGALGEVDHSILLRQFADEQTARRVSPAWRGGAYRLIEHKDGRTVLFYASEWDGAETSAEFFRLYRRVLEKKWTRFRVSSDSPDRLQGEGDDGWFLVRREGPVVTSLEGLRTPEEAR